MEKVIRLSQHPVASKFLLKFMHPNTVLGLRDLGDSDETPYEVRLRAVFSTAWAVSNSDIDEGMFEWAGRVKADEASPYPPFPKKWNLPPILGMDMEFAPDFGGWVAIIKEKLAEAIIENWHLIGASGEEKYTEPCPDILTHTRAIDELVEALNQGEEEWERAIKKAEFLDFLNTPPLPTEDVWARAILNTWQRVVRDYNIPIGPPPKKVELKLTKISPGCNFFTIAAPTVEEINHQVKFEYGIFSVVALNTEGNITTSTEDVFAGYATDKERAYVFLKKLRHIPQCFC